MTTPACIETTTLFINITPVNDSDYVPYRCRPETYLVPLTLAVIFVVGLLGNGTLLVIFVRHKCIRSTPNLYIANLAVGDLIVVIGSVPFIGTIYTFESWPFGLLICKFSEFLRDLSTGVTVFTLISLSAERYMAIVRPMQRYPRKNSRVIVTISLAAVWTFAAAVALPGGIFSFLWKVPVTNTKTIEVCFPFPHHFGEWYPRFIVLIKFVAFYVAPLFVITTLYAMIARSLFRTARTMLHESDGHNRQLKARSKVARMVLALVLFFAFCHFPVHVFMFWFYFYPDASSHYDGFWHVCKILGYILTFASSCINPIALYFLSGLFRHYYRRYLFATCRRKNSDCHHRRVFTVSSPILKVNRKSMSLKSMETF